jgi:hypothetical protein
MKITFQGILNLVSRLMLFSRCKTHPTRTNYDPWFNVAIEKAEVSTYSREYATNGSIWLRLCMICGLGTSGGEL